MIWDGPNVRRIIVYWFPLQLECIIAAGVLEDLQLIRQGVPKHNIALLCPERTWMESSLCERNLRIRHCEYRTNLGSLEIQSKAERRLQDRCEEMREGFADECRSYLATSTKLPHSASRADVHDSLLTPEFSTRSTRSSHVRTTRSHDYRRECRVRRSF